MKFVKFHDPEGQELWVMPRLVSKIKQPVKGQHSVKAHAVVVMGANEQAVSETIQDVLQILEVQLVDQEESKSA